MWKLLHMVVSILILLPSEMCLQIWRAENPDGTMTEFESYWAEATCEERLVSISFTATANVLIASLRIHQAYEMLYRARAKRNASKAQA